MVKTALALAAGFKYEEYEEIWEQEEEEENEEPGEMREDIVQDSVVSFFHTRPPL